MRQQSGRYGNVQCCIAASTACGSAYRMEGTTSSACATAVIAAKSLSAVTSAPGCRALMATTAPGGQPAIAAPLGARTARCTCSKDRE